VVSGAQPKLPINFFSSSYTTAVLVVNAPAPLCYDLQDTDTSTLISTGIGPLQLAFSPYWYGCGWTRSPASSGGIRSYIIHGLFLYVWDY